MESIARNVSEIEAFEREVYENILGQQLQDNQRVIVRVVSIDVEPDAATRDRAMDQACAIAREGRASAAASGVTAEEAGAIIDEEIQEVRQQSRK